MSRRSRPCLLISKNVFRMVHFSVMRRGPLTVTDKAFTGCKIINLIEIFVSLLPLFFNAHMR